MMLRWFKTDIRTRTLAISLGPALLLTLLLTGYFTSTRLHDLREELMQTGQLIANQLAPAAEYGVIAGNVPVLDGLLRASLRTPHVRFIEVRDIGGQVLAYVEQADERRDANIEVFHATIRRQSIALDDPFQLSPPALPAADEEPLGSVRVGMTDEAFSRRQQEILLRAGGLALLALALTLLLAYRLARSLAQPIRAMDRTVQAIKDGNYRAELPTDDSSELGELARHINRLASGLAQADQPVAEGAPASLVVQGGRIAWLGPQDALPAAYAPLPRHDGAGLLATPGLVDCHTHLVYGGQRAGEFAMRLAGASYEEVARAGGGIVSSVRATRAASEDEAELHALADRVADSVANGYHGEAAVFGHALAELRSGLEPLQRRVLARHRRGIVGQHFDGLDLHRVEAFEVIVLAGGENADEMAARA